MKIVAHGPSFTHINKMVDGQIAIIRKWSVPTYIGRIVQRYQDSLIALGEPSGNSWPNLFKSQANCQPPLSDTSEHYVEILGAGTVIEIE
jgi:hypothetical protein